MKKLLYSALVLAIAVTGFACSSSSTGNDKDKADAIVGDWVSQGATNVAPGLQYFKTARINANFAENNTYNVVSIDSTGAEVTFTGTYVLGDGEASAIRTITLEQAEPSKLTSKGIVQIEGSTMTYEVIQTDPAIGAEAPTVTGGFGSTIVGGNATGTMWIQKYTKQ